MVLGMIGFQPVQPVYASNSLRISQVYSGGSGTDATYTHDFIEIFNAGTAAVSLEGLSLQYASATGDGNFGADSGNLTELPNVSLDPGKYFLVQGSGGSVGASLPTPDLTDSTPIDLSNKSGKVALVTGTESLGCNGSSTVCNDEQLARIIDLIGYGTANYYEGTTAAPALSTTLSAQRKSNGCQDTDKNDDDFVAESPVPRNSASPTNTCGPTANPNAVFFSEYIEGGSSNKALEIYNATGAAMDLSDIHIALYANGSTNITNQVTLSGTLADKDVYVIANSAAAAEILAVADITSAVTNFNGDDAIVMRRLSTDTVLDSIGQVGFDPGTAWSDGGVSTLDMTLVRKPDICSGDTNPGDVYVPSLDWIAYPKDTFTYLGSHTSNCNVTPPVGPTVASIVPATGANASKNTDIIITFSEAVTVSTGWYDITCGTSGTHTAAVADANPVFTLNPDTDFSAGETCTVTVDKDLVVNAANEHMAADFVSSFNIVAGCGDPFTAIYDIQGSGDASPIVGQTVTTEGVVTANFQVGGKKGYYIQDATGDGNPATSDGIFVYSATPTVNVGDLLRITGSVSEYYNQTQITPSSASTVLTCNTGQTIAALELTLPAVAPKNYEPLEGMLVTFPQALYISEYFNYDRYGEIVLASSRHFSSTHANEPGAEANAADAAYLLDMIKVDDTLTSQNPPYLRHPDGTQFTKTHYFRGGDTVTGLTGIMDYSNNEYKIQPVGTATYTSLNARPAAPALVAGEIRIASLNVLNYFVTIDNAGNICGPDGNVNCRGADSAEEFTRQRDKIIAAILGMEADVIGLIEIENEHPGIPADAAVIDLVAGLNAATAPDTYAYVATGNIGTDAIKQAFIYKPAKVDQVGEFAVLDETFDPAYDTTRNRPSLAVSFQDKITNEIFTVSVNHLKSKGSACAGDPDLGDGQGNCNLTRTAAATVLVDWLESDPTEAESGMYVIIGDLNSYAKEDPIDAIKLGADGTAGTADDVINLVERFRGDNAYGYVYDGRTGYLDHALANKKFASYVLDANFWNINADEADVFDYDNTFKPAEQAALYSPDAYRSSDHDPVLISLILNHPPTATDDEYTTNYGVDLVVAAPGVLANDTDANIYDKITASLVTGSGPANGTLVFNEDGSFTYTPNDGFVGTDTFQYTMHATPGLMDNYSDTATVTINVVSTNEPPVFTYPVEDASVDELTGMDVEFAAVDSDPMQTVTISVENLPEGATFDAATGKFEWTPTEEQGPGEYTVTIKACDNGGPVLCATKEWKITVNEVNLAPRIYPVIDPQEINEQEEFTITIPVEDDDIPANTFTFSMTGAPEGAVLNSETGVFTWTPTEEQGPGVYTFTVKVCDNGAPSLCAQQNLTITVHEVNASPEFKYPIEDQTIDELVSFSWNFKATDPDRPTQPISYSAENLPEGATFNASTAAFTWTPSEAQGPGEYTITIKACDNFAPPACATATFTLTVNEVNLAPQIYPVIDDMEVDELDTIDFAVPAIDKDIPANVLTISIIDPPDGAEIVEGRFVWTPSEAQGPGEYDITIQVCDDADPVLCGEDTFTVTVNEVNVAPSIEPAIEDMTINEMELTSFTVVAVDPDLPANTLTFSLLGAPAGAAIDATTGEFTWTPTELQGPGVYTFTIKVCDNGTPSLCDEQELTITVLEANLTPVFLYPIEDKAIDELTQVTYDLRASDPDKPAQTISYSMENAPEGAVLNPTTHVFSWTPNEAQGPGVYAVTFKACDNGEPVECAEVIATITVREVNLPPVIAPVPEQEVDELELLTFTATATDPDLPAQTLAFSLKNAPEGATIDPLTGVFTWTPNASQGTQTYLFQVCVSDGTIEVCTNVTVTVNNVNFEPVAVDDAYTTNEDVVLNVPAPGVLENDTDPDSPVLTAVLVETVNHGELTLNADGSFVYTPDQDYNGTDTFTYKASDGTFESEVATVTITINPVNDAPVAVDDAYTVAEDAVLTIAAPGVLANDSDVDGDVLNATLRTNVSHGVLALLADGSFTYTPDKDFFGTDSFTYTLLSHPQTEEGWTDWATVTITVTPVNDAPVLDEIPDFTIPELAPFAFIATASDVDDTELTFSLVNPPAGAAIDPETGEFTWTPTHDQVGEHEIKLCVSDGELEDCQIFKITVTAVNASPVAVEDAYTLNQDQILTIVAPGVLENDTDPENDPLTAVLVATTQHGTLILSADGSFMYVPDAGYYGEDTFTYKAFDGEYYSEEVTVTLTIVKKPVWNLYFPIIIPGGF